jgi:hypothetical protein
MNAIANIPVRNLPRGRGSIAGSLGGGGLFAPVPGDHIPVRRTPLGPRAAAGVSTTTAPTEARLGGGLKAVRPLAYPATSPGHIRHRNWHRTV